MFNCKLVFNSTKTNDANITVKDMNELKDSIQELGGVKSIWSLSITIDPSFKVPSNFTIEFPKEFEKMSITLYEVTNNFLTVKGNCHHLTISNCNGLTLTLIGHITVVDLFKVNYTRVTLNLDTLNFRMNECVISYIKGFGVENVMINFSKIQVYGIPVPIADKVMSSIDKSVLKEYIFKDRDYYIGIHHLAEDPQYKDIVNYFIESLI